MTNYNFKKRCLLFLLVLISGFSFAQIPGTIDNSFNSANFGIGNDIISSVVSDDGKIFVAGAISSHNGINKYGIIKLNSDGSLDTSFDTGSGTFCDNYADVVFHCSLQNDGKIIVAGDFEKFNCVNRGRIVRLNPDGSIDTSFNPSGSLANAIILTTLIQNDGKILIGGLFTSFDGVPAKAIARLNADGSLDTTFLTGTNLAFSVPSPPCSVVTMALQSDNKIIIGGNFNSYNGIARSGIARLNADGSLDTTFEIGTGTSGTVNTCNYLNDGKIVIAGNFNTVNGIPKSKIARLNSDGSIDNSFISPTSINGPILQTAVQNNGKILIGGYFTQIGANVLNRIFRLNPDGSADGFFFPGSGANDVVESVQIQNDGKIIVAGRFTNYSGVAKDRVLRIHGDPVSFPIISIVGESIGTPWETDIDLATTDGISYSLSDYLLPAGEFKFRQDHNWVVNWGGTAAAGTFPSGTGIQDGLNINANGGIYNVSFNRNTGAYHFSSVLSNSEFSNTEISIYPNPTNNTVNISALNNTVNQINVYDLFGRLLKSKRGNNKTEQINLQELPNALYLIEVRMQQGSKMIKIVKQ